MPNTDVKLLRDELAKVIGIARKHELTIREQGDQLVRLALERDRAVLETYQARLGMGSVRAENEEHHLALPTSPLVPKVSEIWTSTHV